MQIVMMVLLGVAACTQAPSQQPQVLQVETRVSPPQAVLQVETGISPLQVLQVETGSPPMPTVAHPSRYDRANPTDWKQFDKPNPPTFDDKPNRR